jgi:hypothetical protein
LEESKAPPYATKIGSKDLEDDNNDDLEVDIEMQSDFIPLHPLNTQMQEVIKLVVYVF